MLRSIERKHRHTRVDVNQHIAAHASKYTTPPCAERAVSNFIGTAIEAPKLMERYDRPPEADMENLAPRSLFIEGRLSRNSGRI